MVRHLPTEPLAVSELPPVTSRDEYEAARAKLLIKEKAHMWHDGQPYEGQCIGCTYFASQVQARWRTCTHAT